MIQDKRMVKVDNCSACGTDHEMWINRMDCPVTLEDKTYGYSGLCPLTGDTVYVMYTTTEEFEHVSDSPSG